MSEYKCISCGAVREYDKDCSCPVCGYRMFAAPYDRKEKLRKEILDFVTKLKFSEIDDTDFSLYRKKPARKGGEEEAELIPKEQDDELRFPDFEKIQGYVCHAQKTEIFYERLCESIEEIRKHIHTPYQQNYTVSTKPLKDEIDELEAVLKQVLTALCVSEKITDSALPVISVCYSETPEDALLGLADQILDLALALAEKIRKFIKQNNIYGTAYQKAPENTFKLLENMDYAAEMDKCLSLLQNTIDKKYTVDIFSDGSDELRDMLKSLWKAIACLMTIPILKKCFEYTIDGFGKAVDDELKTVLLKIIGERYAGIDSVVYAFDFFEKHTEEQLFDLYNKMIELDELGIMGIDKDELMHIGESEAQLNKLIGLSAVKESIRKIKAYALRNKDSNDLNIHMCFLGNPGCGKTEVARYVAGILYENKILPTKKVIEVDRSGLVSEYFGATAEKTRSVIARAMGGVLFIDEAYALGNNSDGGITDYGREAIDTLVKAMEDMRGKFCVIFAGYRNEMQKMLSVNPGLKSRIQFMLDFPNYSRDELKDITELMLKSRQYTIADNALNRMLDITDIRRKDPNFANAREIRNILDQVIMCQNLRCIDQNDKEIGLVDVNKYIQDAKINLPMTDDPSNKAVMTGEDELDDLIGLDSVKRMIRKIKAYAKRNKGDASFNLHMCFYGNPGTGKTEVARILSRILYDAGVLQEAKLVETDAHGLIGKFVGETAPKTLAKINDAMNGVLFIDEAYGLVDGENAKGAGTYGDEAVSVLLKEMEDRRGQFCVILAGYKDEMNQLISSNPGLESRVQFTLDFPDYTREELGQIAVAFLKKKKYTINDAALDRLLDVTEYYRGRSNFANARTVRNILDQVIMNQNLRTEDMEDDSQIVLSDVEEYITDEKIDLNKVPAKRKIGF